MRKLTDYLALHATERPRHTAVACGNESLSYAQLRNAVAKKAEELAAQHTRGQGVVARATPTIDFLVLYLACHLAGLPFVPLGQTVPQADYDSTESLVKSRTIADDVADILFTTGTTGLQKGVMTTHEAIIANAENLIGAQLFSGDLTFVIAGPLNHIGSLSKLWPMIIVGGTIVITEGMKNAESFLQALSSPKGKVATFLVPATLRMMLRFGEQTLTQLAPKLDFIETGAAPLSQSDMEQLCRLLPHTRLYNTYASTETGIIATHDYCHDGCIAGCLGRPMRHSQIHISREGIISCSGKTLMKGYFGDDELTRKILYDNRLHTSDIGRLDEKGRLRLAGRADDVINIGGYKVLPTEVENAAMEHPDIADCICVGVEHPIMGQALKLIYVSRVPSENISRSIANHIKTRLEAHKVPSLYEEATAIRRTFNGKLDRKSYKAPSPTT